MPPYLGELATAGIVRANKIQSSFTELRYAFSDGQGYIFEDLVTFHKFRFSPRQDTLQVR
jgi:hypothetical protein